MTRSPEYDITKDELVSKYVDEGLSISECAGYFDCSTSPIEDRLRRFDIPIRSRGNQPLDLPENELRRLYVEEGNSTNEIAERFDCHPSTIGKRLIEYGIPTSGANHGHSVTIPEEELRQLYVEESLTTYELADRFNCDPTVIERRLHWFGIEERHTIAGDGNWQYKYGSDWRTQRRRALERADYRCERCGNTEAEHRDRYLDRTRGVAFGLDVHHRVRVGLYRRWDVASVADANRLSNLEVLCQACHATYGDRVGTSER